MATTKKKPAVKKTTVKAKTSAVAHKPAKKKHSSSPSTELRSFAPATESTPFFTFKPSIQTVYWLILGVMVLSLGAWVININARVQNIYNQIDANTSASNFTVPVKKKTP